VAIIARYVRPWKTIFGLDLEGYSFGFGLGLVFSGHRLRSGLRTDSTNFMTGAFLLSISVFYFTFLHYSFSSLWPPYENLYFTINDSTTNSTIME